MWIGAGVNLFLGLLFLYLAVTKSPSFFIAGSICTAVGAVLAFIAIRAGRSAREDAAVLQSGIQGTATVTALAQTGWYVNNQPQVKMTLQVSAPGQPDRVVEHKEVFSLIDVGKLETGMRLPVRIDPAHPDHVVINWQGSAQAPPTAVPAVFDSAAPAAGINSATAQLAMTHIQQAGLDGTGTIIAFEDRGGLPNGNHHVVYDMLVAVPGQPPNTLHKDAELPAIAIPMMQVGKTFPLKLDPANPEHPMVALS